MDEIDALQTKCKRYEKALKDIIKHQEIIYGDAFNVKLSASWNIATKALSEHGG